LRSIRLRRPPGPTPFPYTTLFRSGATLPIETNRVHSLNRGFKLTGKLGDVMKESAEIAYSYICANLATYQADRAFFDEAFVHMQDRKSTRLNSSHVKISYAVFCLK